MFNGEILENHDQLRKTQKTILKIILLRNDDYRNIRAKLCNRRFIKPNAVSRYHQYHALIKKFSNSRNLSKKEHSCFLRKVEFSLPTRLDTRYIFKDLD
jgi:hypothetical protein